MTERNIQPSLETQEEAVRFFENLMTDSAVPMKAILQINIAVDEVFSNIVRYSGATKAILGCDIDDHCVTLRFSDNGMPYNPLEKPDPDVTLSAEEREIGGLGIFMVKKIMDVSAYEYVDGFNVLTLEKNFD